MNLNNEIKNKINDCKDKKEFEKEFDAFNNWADKLIEKLKK